MAIIYEDRRGWRYKVMPDLAGKFCPRFHKPESGPDVGWKTCKSFQHRNTREESELDLEGWAMRKGMNVVGSVP